MLLLLSLSRRPTSTATTANAAAAAARRHLLSTLPDPDAASTTTATTGKPPVHLRNYLDAWMGATGVNPKKHNTSTPTSSSSQRTTNNNKRTHIPATALTVAGKSYLVPTLRLPRGVSPDELGAGLQATTSLSAGYFKSAPIVVDLSEWMTSQPLPRGGVPTAAGALGEVLDGGLLRAFVLALREAGLHPVGISNVTATDVQAEALEMGLPCFMGRRDSSGGGGGGTPIVHTTTTTAVPPPPPPSSPSAVAAAAPAKAKPKPALHVSASLRELEAAAAARAEEEMKEEKKITDNNTKDHKSTSSPSPSSLETTLVTMVEEPHTDTHTQTTTPLPTKVIHGSVRTGQQVFAEGASLVILGHVNSGAEVSADGDIHVYGKLTGRALAGLSGDVKAKIFAGRFEAELVAVADVFTTCDVSVELPGCVVGGAVGVSLEEDGKGGGGQLKFHSFKV